MQAFSKKTKECQWDFGIGWSVHSPERENSSWEKAEEFKRDLESE
jgi:hypothetical protein